jgi:uncharacterized protein YjiS (DUF1127 family)
MIISDERRVPELDSDKHLVSGAIRFHTRLHAVLYAVHDWSLRLEERRQLAEMSEYEQRDIGVTRWEVMQEINKPFWR